MVLFTICVMIILTPKQFHGLSVSYLHNSTQILNMIEISAVQGHDCHLQSYCFVLSICCFWCLSAHLKMSLY